MAKGDAAGTPKWILYATGVVGIVSALFIAVAKYHDIRKSRAEAEKARVEAEIALADAKRIPQPKQNPEVSVPPSNPDVSLPQPKPEVPAPAPQQVPNIVMPLVQEGVRDFRAEPPFDKYLKANPLLLELSGVKVIGLKDGGKVVIAVASTEIMDNSASERIRAEKVCRIKCDVALLKEKEGVYVAHAESLNDEAITISTQGGATQKSLAEVLETTSAKVEGLVKVMPPVGRWKSADGKMFFLATGICLNRDSDLFK